MNLLQKLLEPVTIINGGIFKEEEVYSDSHYGYPFGVKVEGENLVIGVAPQQRHLATADIKKLFPTVPETNYIFTEPNRITIQDF